jgi:cytochrome c oxidase subunit III
LASPTLEKIGPGAPRPPQGPDDSGPGGSGDRGSPGILGDPSRFGLLAFLGTVSMLFIGFTSAYILRRASADWQPLAAPGILWVNTAILVVSSVSLEIARRRLRSWDLAGAQKWMAGAAVLGLAFLAGQVLGWREFQGRGVFLSSNPHSAFFYLLTGVHALHLVGGLAWGFVTLWRLRRMAVTPGGDGLALFATYWHFLGALWLYLLFLLFGY